LILVISSIANEAAPSMVDQFPEGAASLITTTELNKSFKAGISVNDFEFSLITMNNKQAPVRDISGVVCTVPYFLPQEFYYIESADRDYVCAEMNAFFIYFLSTLRCKKINPPSVKSFTGLSMHKFEWIKIVHHLKIPIWPFELKNGAPVGSEDAQKIKYYTWTLIGKNVVENNVPENVQTWMRQISKAFSLPYLSCVFVSVNRKDYFLWNILSIPSVDTEESRNAIVNYFLKSA
jgi:hypothetical protein